MNQDSKNSASAKTSKTLEKGILTLQAQAVRQKTSLTLHYRVSNESEQAVYLVNRVFRWTQAGLSIDANVIYTELFDGSLQLTKACIPVPERMKIEAPSVPYLTALAAGEQMAEDVHLALPLQPYHAYDQVRSSSTIHVFDSFTFAVGWLPAEKVTVRGQQRPDGTTLLSTDYGPVIQHQEILQVTLPVAVPAYVEVKEEK